MKFFDAHTHLNGPDLYPQRRELVQNFIDAGGKGIVNIGVDHTYNTRGIEIARQAKDLFPDTIIKTTIGLHPYEVAIGTITQDNLNEKIDQLYRLYEPSTFDSIVAIGEIGIDTYHPNTDHTLELQKNLFRRQCEWAREIRLPIVIHSRANREATHEVLQDFTDLTIYFHCRSYTPTEIQIIQETYPDFYIGFTGNITYPKAIDIRTSLRYLVYGTTDYPDHIISGAKDMSYKVLGTSNKQLITNNILIETDAPYLPPVPHRGKPNEPAHIVHTYAYISSLLNIDITDAVIHNTKTLYNIT